MGCDYKRKPHVYTGTGPKALELPALYAIRVNIATIEASVRLRPSLRKNACKRRNSATSAKAYVCLRAKTHCRQSVFRRNLVVVRSTTYNSS